MKERTKSQAQLRIEMIIDPPINELLDKVNQRFNFAVVVSKRARQLVSGDAPLIDIDPDEKPVSIAAKEMYGGKFECRQWFGEF